MDENERFTRILSEATAAVHHNYFLLPVKGTHPAYRERVYCYELYHQMRLRWPCPCAPDFPYCLNGEIDKRGNPKFKKGAPDFLVHVPDTSNNYAVIEVKTYGGVSAIVHSDRVPRGVCNDLRKLKKFKCLGYRRPIYLIYGTELRDGEKADAIIDGIVRTCVCVGLNPDDLELWLHAEIGVACTPISRQS